MYTQYPDRGLRQLSLKLGRCTRSGSVCAEYPKPLSFKVLEQCTLSTLIEGCASYLWNLVPALDQGQCVQSILNHCRLRYWRLSNFFAAQGMSAASTELFLVLHLWFSVATLDQGTVCAQYLRPLWFKILETFKFFCSTRKELSLDWTLPRAAFLNGKDKLFPWYRNQMVFLHTACFILLLKVPFIINSMRKIYSFSY